MFSSGGVTRKWTGRAAGEFGKHRVGHTEALDEDARVVPDLSAEGVDLIANGPRLTPSR